MGHTAHLGVVLRALQGAGKADVFMENIMKKSFSINMPFSWCELSPLNPAEYD